MTNTEDYLRKVWYAGRDRIRLRRDLILAQSAYESAYENQCSNVSYDTVIQKQPSRRSPTEQAAIIIVDEHKAQLDSIERELLLCRGIIDDVERTVEKAKLSCREEEYVRLRYFKSYSVERVAKELYCSTRTAERTRKTALDKIERVRTC